MTSSEESQSPKRLRVLLVEDEADDAELTLHELGRAGYSCEAERVETPEAFQAALEKGEWSVILADFGLPRFSAPAALKLLQESGRDIPFIIVSGSIGEGPAVKAMKAGAHDFFAKGKLGRLGAAVEREIRECLVRRERKEALAQLRSAEERYRLVVENVREYAIFMLAPDGNVKSWNRGAERLTGYTEDEIVGAPLSTFFSEEDRQDGRPEEGLQLARDQGSQIAEGFRRRRDGSLFWAECTLDCIGGKGELVGFSAVLHDITERKRLLDDLRHAVRARDEFLSIASHELRTPLTSMGLQLQSLAALERSHAHLRLSDEKIAKKLATVSRQAERLTALIENLLDVTRITSGRIQLRREKVDLGVLVDTVVSRMREWSVRSGCEVSVVAEEGLVGSWDRLRLETAVTNLLSNAIKYGAGKPVDVFVEAAGPDARVRVRDGGIGISADETERIFQRFERAVPEHHYGGFGIGLWLVRQVVEAHGGSISVESRTGEGSTFTISLPRSIEEP
jgi:PAS domain S-box-containing protein